MFNGLAKVPFPRNEPIVDYAEGRAETFALRSELDRQKAQTIEIPAIVGGKELRTGRLGEIRAPHDRSTLLATYHKADAEVVRLAAEAAMRARKEWRELPWHSRAAIFLKAADLLSTKYRSVLNAATILGQSKTAYQAEIDSACELIDFFRFNAFYMNEIYANQPLHNSERVWNQLEYRPLEGFVFALSPFNFTSIGGNLSTAPAVMGNVVVWKPASAAVLSNYYIMKLLKEAGLPDGAINFVPGDGAQVGDAVLDSGDFAGLHFTGSTGTFNAMWLHIAENVERNAYRVYPRIVGETGGKGFVFAHKDCNVPALAVALFKGAFEYQGQKCSATSRAYVPRSIWPEVLERLRLMVAESKVGDASDLSVFMGAVIDGKAYEKITSYIEYARKAPEDYAIVAGGSYDDSKGWFVSPTVIATTDPKGKLMREEIFGPVLTVYVYDDDEAEAALGLVNGTSPYALTGSVFANDRVLIERSVEALSEAAGNIYINDKSTGAVVGQQPFGGARASGTNDKAGSVFNLLRWTSVRSIKENFFPPEKLK